MTRDGAKIVSQALKRGDIFSVFTSFALNLCDQETGHWKSHSGERRMMYTHCMQKETTQSSRVRAYNFMREELLPDPSTQGTFITEEDVANRIGNISRTPVREAFLLLSAEGLIELVPRHGAYIPPVKYQEIEEVLEFREMIETKAAHDVIANNRVPIEAMQIALEHQARVTGHGAEREFNRWDTEFHLALVRGAGNSLMTKIYSDLRTRQIRMGVRLLLSTQDRQQEVMAEHQAILDALKAHDLSAAIAALSGHILKTAEGLKKI
ncbi:GntR family transcriptional regulator [Herbaspirillum sp. 1130]|uniref:GntR family transcriptional regulator n=1 Tax=Herbaspirillum sp. 1130 TaxID=2806562 RepID=UPI001AE42402|nr:GntR family transcriptional regulator [Herbaspirillum sp. 1130]MBP1318298.1 DNA-binding GntR family transcriptional regulator [Herbaspirillum sp. 1130]